MKILKIVLLSFLLMPVGLFAQTQNMRVGNLTVTGTSGTVLNITPTGSQNRFSINTNGDATLTNPDNGFRGLKLKGSDTSNKQVGMVVADYATNFSSRKDRVVRFGYNPGFEEASDGEHAVYLTFESYFEPLMSGQGQSETYFEAFSGNHLAATRPIGWNIPIDATTARVQNLSIDADNIVWVDGDGGLDDLKRMKISGSLELNSGNSSVTGTPYYIAFLAKNVAGDANLALTLYPQGNLAGGVYANYLPELFLDGRSVGGATLVIQNPSGTASNARAFAIQTNGADVFAIRTDGIPIMTLPTGAAGGKKVVCYDSGTGMLHVSSTGTDCTN